jgi:hypothetical protein
MRGIDDADAEGVLVEEVGEGQAVRTGGFQAGVAVVHLVLAQPLEQLGKAGWSVGE